VRKTVVIVDPDQKHSKEMCSVLEGENYSIIALLSLNDLASRLHECSPCALIIDFDLVPTDNKTLKELRTANRDLCIIGVSNRTFHPELKEALRHYIDACFARPLDYEDLLYYIRGALQEPSEE
jgi:DNA-binding NtrC family response regulator